VRVGVAPQDRNAVRWAADVGIAWNAPFAARDSDTLALGFVHMSHSKRFAQSQSDGFPGSAPLDFEDVAELSYSAALNDRCLIRPSLQYIRHPGGSAQLPDALVALVRVEASY